MSRLGARIFLVVLLILLCVPLYYMISGGGNPIRGNSTISDVTIPDEDPRISEDQAIETLLKRVHNADYDNILEFSQSYEEGGWVYEGSIQGKDVIYAYQVDGDNGEILMWIPQKK